MKYLNILFTLALMLVATASRAAITGQWVMHPTFDNSVTKVIDTPKRTYFMGYNQQIAPHVASKTATDQTLFFYDKEGDEIMAAYRAFPLSYPSVDKIEYNPVKKYLLILYMNQDIDLLYDSGEVVNIPALLHADIPGARGVNSISFYPWKDGVWLATDFGYVLINDEKYEVSDSRNYGTPFRAATQLNDQVILTTATATYIAPIVERRLSMSEYSTLDLFKGAEMLYPLSTQKMVVNTIGTGASPNTIRMINLNSDNKPEEAVMHNPWGPVTFCPTASGLTLLYTSKGITYGSDGVKNVTYFDRPKEDEGIMTCASWDNKEFFTALPRKGLRSVRLNSDGSSALTRDFMLPNAPNAYWSRGMAYHPKYGMLVNSHGPEQIFNATGLNAIDEPILLSGLSNGNWTPYSPAYRNPSQYHIGYDPFGLAIDPADNRYVYSGSPFSGMVRLNLEDPNDIIHYTYPDDPTANLPGYVEANPTQPLWERLCHFSAPKFDSQNTLWSHFTVQGSPDVEFRYLTEADRKASTNAATARPWQKLVIPGVETTFASVMSPLVASQNRNLFIYMTGGTILVYNTNGTNANTSDDTRAIITGKVFDQDGGEVDLFGTNCLYEDPSTGFVWFGTNSGVYYLQPQSILRGQTSVNRIKVARNDGTSLADYLLNGVGVRAIVTDDQGRKWFGSAGAGIIVTSGDGKTVYAEFTSDNSGLPSNYIYNLCFNPATKSMMVSTDLGLAEFFIGGDGANRPEDDQVRAYPNPVAPDYYGWVTIDGLPDNSLVKIVDATGNLVRELGRAESGSIQWDILNLDNRRVNTGVYYVLSSPASGSGESNVAKILVMN